MAAPDIALRDNGAAVGDISLAAAAGAAASSAYYQQYYCSMVLEE
jgi:hypothetical protein